MTASITFQEPIDKIFKYKARFYRLLFKNNLATTPYTTESSFL